MHNLDILSESPPIYIFQGDSNKKPFGGFISILFILYMIFISAMYIYDYFVNEKYDIEYSRYYSPITGDERDRLNSDPELNPEYNFVFKGADYIKNNYSNNFAFYDRETGKFYKNISFVNITQNVSTFNVELVYKCKSYLDDECLLREEDKNISKYEDFFAFDFIYPIFILDHSKPDPFERGHNLSENHLFDFNRPTQHSLEWKVIKYQNEESLFQFLDSWRGVKNEFTAGYLDYHGSTPIPTTYRIQGWFNPYKYKVIGRIRIYNLHTVHEEYKRKYVHFLDVLADIFALYLTIQEILAMFFNNFYSTSFDNHKLVKNLLLKKIKKNEENVNNNNTQLQLLPTQNNASINNNGDDNDTNNLDNNLIDNKVDDDDDNNQEVLHLQKISWIRYLLNNISCIKCGSNVQERIETCNEIIEKYMTYEGILYNQIMFEQLLKDYKWNDKSLKQFTNGELFLKLKYLELGFT